MNVQATTMRHGSRRNNNSSMFMLCCDKYYYKTVFVLCLFWSAATVMFYYSSQQQQQVKLSKSRQRQDDVMWQQQQMSSTQEFDNEESAEDDDCFVLFSTSCSPSMDWQSYVFFYHAMMVKQPGHVIRIASGCTHHEVIALQTLFKQHISDMSDKFHLHLTPDYSGPEQYMYYNKPLGVKHFMEHYLGYYSNSKNTTKWDNAVIILMDPDQILLKPITRDFTNTKVIWDNEALGEEEGTQRTTRTQVVTHGYPMAQAYELGDGPFVSVNLTNVLDTRHSAAMSVSSRDAIAHYSAGPPYLLTAKDMYKLVVTWTDIVHATYQDYPDMLAEMYAYSIAAAHENLPHQLAQSFMVSNAMNPIKEGWPLLFMDDDDKYPSLQNVCKPKTIPTSSLPHVLHYCQDYKLGNWYFYKDDFLLNLFSCETPLLAEPPLNVGLQHDYYIDQEALADTGQEIKKPLTPIQVKRQAWSLCNLIPRINQAAQHFKQHQCKDGGNLSKTHVVHIE